MTDDDFDFALPRSWTRRGRPGRKVRVGDAEREAVAAALREHYAQGRLTGDDLDERLAAVFTARYADDLRRITDDLPGSSGLPGSSAAASGRGHERYAPWLIFAIVVVALVGGRGFYPGSLLVFLLAAAGIAVVAAAALLARRRT